MFVEISMQTTPMNLLSFTIGYAAGMIILPVTSLLNGAAVATITILGYSAMAGTLGGGGLGDIAIRYGHYRFQPTIMWITILVLVIIVQIMQEIGIKIAAKMDNRIN